MYRIVKLIPCVLLAAFVGPVESADYPTSYPFPQANLPSGPEIRFCIDKRDPMWPAQEAIAREIALNLGRPAEIHVAHEESDRVAGYQPASTRQEFLVMLARHCDAYMGLPGSTTAAFDYPADEQMLASRPFYRASFLLVSRDPEVEGLTDLSPDERLGLHARGVPYMLLMSSRPDSVRVARYYSTAEILTALEAGEIDHAIVYGPRLYDRMRKPAEAGYHVSKVTSLPNMDWYVFAGLRSDRPTLRQKFDAAIERMIGSGRVAEILANNGFPPEFFPPAEIDAALPDDDFGDAEDGQ